MERQSDIFPNDTLPTDQKLEINFTNDKKPVYDLLLRIIRSEQFHLHLWKSSSTFGM